MLGDKSQMVKVLGEVTRVGDIILFANDAPNFI
jgi:UDP-N-acetylmuramoyl-tripeptide--D-alanyl-D-alanine ligase